MIGEILLATRGLVKWQKFIGYNHKTENSEFRVTEAVCRGNHVGLPLYQTPSFQTSEVYPNSLPCSASAVWALAACLKVVWVGGMSTLAPASSDWMVRICTLG